MQKVKCNLDYKKLAELFWQQGFLMLEDFFSPALISTSQTMIMSHFGESPAFAHDEKFIALSKAEVVPWFPQQEGIKHFDKIEQDKKLQRLTEEILGCDWKPQYCMVMFSKQDSAGQAWHQDCPPEDSSQFNLNRLVYTMDINEQDGGQIYIKPGSHKQGAITKGPLFEDFADQIVLSPKQGTLVLLHGHCWHRVGAQKGKSRVSTNYRAAPKVAGDDITDICVYRNMRYQFSSSKIVNADVTE